jgi:menaquinone-dependent protoporphyrinogen IX oxidase
MEKPILLTYITSSKSRWEIIDFMAEEMKQQGAKVEVIPAGSVRSLDEYKMVVLGGPVYAFMWPKDLHRFLKKHNEVLSTLPTAVFAIGTNLDEEVSKGKPAQQHINDALLKFSWFKPFTMELFNIELSVDKTPFPLKIFQKQAASEAKVDWNAMRNWARELVKA